MVGLIIIENTIKEKENVLSTEMQVNENDWWIETGVNGEIWL